MKEKRRGLWIFLISMLVLALAGGGVFFALRYQPRPRKIAPGITVISPNNPTTVAAGEFLYIQTSAQASAGITRVEMAVDGAPYRYQEPDDVPMLVMPVDFSWRANTSGTHTLTFNATDAEGSVSPPATLEVVVTEAMAIAEASADSGFTIPADVDVWAGVDVDPVMDRIGEGAAAEAEHQDGNDGDAEGAENLGQAEDDGEMDEGENDELIEGIEGLPIDKPPFVRLVDGSMREGGGLHILVSAIAEDDIGIDSMIITHENEANELDPEVFTCEGEPICERVINYQLNAGQRTLYVAAYDISGQVSMTEIIHFQVAPGEGGQPPALVIDRDFDPRDIELIEEEVEEEQREHLDDFGAPRITGYECGGNIVRIGVPYRYYSNNGNYVYAGGFAGEGGDLIAAGWVPIEYRSNGLVQFEMETTTYAEEGQSTDGITLQMMKEIGDTPFYAEQADLNINWPQPKPDLLITDITRKLNGTEISVTVENRGCADADEFKLVTYINPNFRHSIQTFTEGVAAGGTQTVSFISVDANAFSHAFSVVVDPDDTIDEIDEYNNVFQKSPIQIQYIHFNIIDILDTSDGELTESSGQGEFRLYVAAHDAREVRPAANKSWVWKMGWGSHDIGGVVFPIKMTPNLPLDWPLTIVVDLEEDDTFAPNDWDKATIDLSADMNDPNSWKIEQPGERVLKSIKGRFQIHYIIYLDD